MTTPAVTWQSYPPEKLLTERFHITNGFHPEQRDIIEQLVQGKRILTGKLATFVEQEIRRLHDE